VIRGLVAAYKQATAKEKAEKRSAYLKALFDDPVAAEAMRVYAIKAIFDDPEGIGKLKQVVKDLTEEPEAKPDSMILELKAGNW
jgi:hypothetical protein